jgi:hypothetical protein
MWKQIGRVSQMVMRVSAMMSNTGTELGSEADDVMMEGLVRAPDCDKRDDHCNYGFRRSSL